MAKNTRKQVTLSDNNGHIMQQLEEITKMLNEGQKAIKFTNPKTLRVIVTSAYNKLAKDRPKNFKDLDNLFT